ncbi:MAG: histidine phosphatase family protein [Alkalibacterium sp.]|nr:histidine phosphatase family protein [Alkalibacterium sp.]
MSYELLLVRHGKAEERSADKNDVLRELTDKGKDEFADFLTIIKDDLETDKEVSVWTSPLTRARQTADILTDNLDLNDAEEKDFIANGDFDALVEDIKQQDTNTRVVCVGHEPSLGYWIEELTGSEYSFKKGGMALVQLNETDPSKGKLIWDNNPKADRKE